ncbi:unnamed protein product [Cuscuta campestris]|uniref:Uncharacterized protein n=1 Tax=Cuscuta campestris TaxID=132261 RepID=A0A484MA88_9ASTE|nr:unnamed protein product [Cuscuta campestris]
MSKVSSLFRTQARNFSLPSRSSALSHSRHGLLPPVPAQQCFKNPFNGFQNNPRKPALRHFSTAHSEDRGDESRNGNRLVKHGTSEDVEPIESWEEEEEVEPELGDGGDGGGVVFQNCPWGEQALSIANEVLKEHTVDMELYAFKTSPKGYIYVRLDKHTNEYGCPSMDEMEGFSHEYKKRLDEAGTMEEFPDDLALEVSSPGAERLLKVPDDLNRFKHMPMRVSFVGEDESQGAEDSKILLLDCIDAELGKCVWKLVDVKENRDPSAKGRPLSRKQKDWRLSLSYNMIKQVTLFISH